MSVIFRPKPTVIQQMCFLTGLLLRQIAQGLYPFLLQPPPNRNPFFRIIRESEVTFGQVWWPILWIRALHLTHPKCIHTAVNTHTPWTHTWSSGQPFMLRRLGSSCGFLLKVTSVVVLRVERALDIHSPHRQSLPDWDSNFRLRVQLSNH